MLNYFDFIYFFLGFLILVMGFLVIYNNSKSKNSLFFFLFVLSVVGWMISLHLGYGYTDYAIWNKALFWMRLSYGFSILGMSFMTIFIYLFPRPIFALPAIVKYLYLGFTLFLFLVASFTPLINEYFFIADNIYIKDTLGALYSLYALDLVLNLVASIVISIVKLRKIQGVEKEKMAFVTFGYFAFVILAVLTNVILPIFDIVILQREIPILIVAFIVPAYYATQRFRFFHLSYISLKFARGGILLTSFVVATVFVNELLTSYLPAVFDFTPMSDLGSIVISSFLGLGFYVYLKSIFPELLGFGFKELQNTLTEFKSKIFYCDTYLKLRKIMEEILLVKLNFVQAKLFITRKKEFKTNIPTHMHDDFTRALKKFGKDALVYDEIRFRKLDEKTKKILKTGMGEMETDLCIPLHSENNLIGFLAMKKKSEKPYAKEEIKEMLRAKKDLEICLMNVLLKMNLQEENNLMKKIIDKKTKELRKKIEEIKELVKQQSDFMAMTAHELRTPLSIAMFQMEDILESNKNSQKTSKDLKLVNDALDNLKNLTKKLFEVQQYDLKKVQAHLEKAKIKKWIRSIYRDFKKIMAEKNISFKLKDNIKKERIVKMDKSQIHQVIGNLLNNAYKFTPSNGEILLGIKVENKHITITVQDNGSGIPKRFKKTVFNKFKTQRKGSGIGLGLYISKKIVELHKGKIWMENVHDGGALFHVQLPL